MEIVINMQLIIYQLFIQLVNLVILVGLMGRIQRNLSWRRYMRVVQLSWTSNPTMILCSMRREYTVQEENIQIFPLSRSGRKWIIRFCVTGGAKRMERSIGYFRIVGVQNGVNRETSGTLWIIKIFIIRMQRGTDDSAIESMTEYANPIVVNRA